MDRGSRNSSIALVAVILASLGAGWLVFTRIVLARPEPGWDEAAHAIQGALIAHDVGGGHLVGLLFDTYRQFYWTPLNSWLVAISFLVAGPSMEAARAVSTISYVLLAPVLFLLAETISPRPNGVAGTLAAALGLTLPGVVEQGALAMLEVPGMLLISGTLLVECRLQRSRGDPPRRHALVGIGVVLTFLMKTNIGVLLGLVLVLGRLIRVGFRPRRLWTAESLWAALPVAAFLAFWFAYPPKLTWTWNGLVNVPWGDVERWSLDGLLFYPRAIAELAGSWWMAILLFSSAIWAWTLRDRPGIEPLALLPPLLLVIGEIHHNKLERHILPMFPPMVVLAGVAGARIWETLGRKGGGRRVGVVVLVVLALLHGNGLVEREWVERSRAPRARDRRRLADASRSRVP